MDPESSKRNLTFEITASLLAMLHHAPFINGFHLVSNPWRDGLVPALRIHGARHKRIVLVQKTSDEAYEASEQLPFCRVVHASATDIAKEQRHRFSTAYLNMGGPLTAEGMEEMRDVLVHGMAEGSVLTTTFDVGGETGEYKGLIAALRSEGDAPVALNAAGQQVDNSNINALVLRGRVVRRQLKALMRGAQANWLPAYAFYYTRTDGAALLTCAIQGVVIRSARRAQEEEAFWSTKISSCDITEETLRRRVLKLYDSFERGLPDCDRDRETFLQKHLHELFNIDKETIDQWRIQAAATPTDS